MIGKGSSGDLMELLWFFRSRRVLLLEWSRRRLAPALSTSPPSLPQQLDFFFFFKATKRKTGSSLHYLISLLLVHLLMNSFLTPSNLYTFLGLFQLEGFIGVIQYPSPPFASFPFMLSVQD